MMKFLCSLLSLGAVLSADASGLYSAIDILPFDPHGWFINEFALDKILKENDIKTVVEIGPWAGAATRFFGYRVGPEGRVFAIDTWKGSTNNTTQMKDRRLPHLMQLFLSNVVQAGLTDVIVPVPLTSDDAAKLLNVKADLIYLDGDHSEEQVYRDIMNWYPHLSEGGILCGNDWNCKTVEAGANRAARELGKQIKVDTHGIFWSIN